MSFPQQAELKSLGDKVSQGLSKEELNRLIQLTTERNEWLANQEKIILDIANFIKRDKVSLIDLVKHNGYSKRDLELAAVHFKLIEADTNENADQPNQFKSEIKRVQKSGPIVFTFEKVGGFRSSQIRTDSSIPATPNESHIAFFLKQGKTKEKLLQLKEKTPENESFLKSADGTKLVNEWVNWFDTKVKNYVEKHPAKVPAKA